MSEWSYIYAAYGLTWGTFVVYALYLRARRRRVEAAADAARAERRQS